MLHFHDFFDRDFFRILKYSSKYFYGIKKSTFENLIKIGRGNFNYLSEIKITPEEYFNESVIYYPDNTVLSDSKLVQFKGFEQF